MSRTFLIALTVWLPLALLIVGLAWFFTRKLGPRPRLLIRAGVIALALGVTGFGSDGAAIPIPLAVFAWFRPRDIPELIPALLFNFALIAGIYAGACVLRESVQKKKNPTAAPLK